MDTATDPVVTGGGDAGIVTGGGDAGMRQASLDFAHDVSAARQARRLVHELLDGSDDELVEGVRLVASELVTNVILHTDDGGSLRVVDPRPRGPVRIEVADRDHRPPPS